MKVEISGVRVPVTEEIDNFVKKKLKKLDRYFNQAIACHVILRSEKKGFYEAEINLLVKGLNINGKEVADNLYTAIERAIDKVNKQSKKYKEKKISHKSTWHRGTFQTELATGNRERPRIVITRKIAKPMRVDEASMQLDLSEDNFLVFLNAETNQINVIYKIDDDHFGLVQPE